MPKLPDGTFASGAKWFALRGRPKNHSEVGAENLCVERPSCGIRVRSWQEFWAKYDGFGGDALAFQAGPPDPQGSRTSERLSNMGASMPGERNRRHGAAPSCGLRLATAGATRETASLGRALGGGAVSPGPRSCMHRNQAHG